MGLGPGIVIDGDVRPLTADRYRDWTRSAYYARDIIIATSNVTLVASNMRTAVSAIVSSARVGSLGVEAMTRRISAVAA